MGPVAVAARVAAEPELATLATAYPSPPAVAPPKPRRRVPAVVLIALGLILLLAVGGVVAWSVFDRPVTLAVTPDTVVAGDTVVVTASHVPPNTVGEVQLWSVERIVAFRSDPSGNVAVTLDIPRYLEPGEHLVKVCWSGTCHASQTLRVIAPVAFATPSPSANPPATPSPHATPTATPRSTPVPTLPPTPYITNPGISKLSGFYVAFHYFGGGTWNVSLVQFGKPYAAGSVAIPPGNTYDNLHFSTPTLVLSLQSAGVIACNGSGKCYAAPAVTVSA
jgi:hypothetical protein